MRKPNRLVAGLVALNAVTLVALIASAGGAGVLPSAQASYEAGQPEPDTTPPFNAAEQRKQMIVQLETVSKKLSELEKKLSSGISVKVTEMPEVVVKDTSKKK